MGTEEASRGALWTRCIGSTPRDRRNMSRMMGLFLVWTASFVAGTQLIKRDLLPAGPIPWVVAALPTVVGIFVVVAYSRFLREADELQRLIHLEALALGFGGGWVAVCGYRILERAGAPAVDIGDAVLALAIFYSIGIVRGAWRYR